MEYMFLPLKRYADFSGRSRRMEYWMWVLFQIILYILFLGLSIAFVGSVASAAPDDAMATGGAAMILMAVYGVVWLALLVPSLAVSVRRLHDTGRSGWWVLAFFLSYFLVFFAMGAGMASPDNMAAAGGLSLIAGLLVFVLGIVLLVFMLLDGTPGPNKYGPDPKGRGEGAVFA